MELRLSFCEEQKKRKEGAKKGVWLFSSRRGFPPDCDIHRRRICPVNNSKGGKLTKESGEKKSKSETKSCNLFVDSFFCRLTGQEQKKLLVIVDCETEKSIKRTHSDCTGGGKKTKTRQFVLEWRVGAMRSQKLVDT